MRLTYHVALGSSAKDIKGSLGGEKNIELSENGEELVDGERSAQMRCEGFGHHGSSGRRQNTRAGVDASASIEESDATSISLVYACSTLLLRFCDQVRETVLLRSSLLCYVQSGYAFFGDAQNFPQVE
jgi:hypothetical protein